MKTSHIIGPTKRVTKKWAKQVKSEDRNSRARSRRESIFSDRICQSDVAWPAIQRAYLKASDSGRLPAHARQIYYAAREEIREATGREVDSKYFTQCLLPRCVGENSTQTADWKVVYDPRGHYTEPHTGRILPLGTLEVDYYLRKIVAHEVKDISAEPINLSFPTYGPENRISAVLFIEKEGFNPLFEAVKLAERYDLAIMSTKGQSVIAARCLVDHLCGQEGIPLLVLHDFDKYGLSIAENLTAVSEAAEDAGRVRYEFRNPINFIDLGLRLKDVEKWHLEAETVQFKGQFSNRSIATPEEKTFLRSHRRVELNAFTSPDFISWIEGSLEALGIKKVVPDDEVLSSAYRRAYQGARMKMAMARIEDDIRNEALDARLPSQLAAMIRKAFKENPEQPWDKTLANIAENAARKG